MFSKCSKVTVACVVAVMMMMMMMMMTTTEAAAMPKHPVKTHRKSSDGGAAGETVPLQLDPKAFAPTRFARPLHSTSISPWTYNETFDESLFPPTLSEARCLLTGCLNSEGQEDLNLESKPIMHEVRLLRRVRAEGARTTAAAAAGATTGAGPTYHYRLETRLIAVGCTCVRPAVQLQV